MNINLIMVLCSLMLFVGCSELNNISLDNEPSSITDFKDINKNPENYIGKNLSVEGYFIISSKEPSINKWVTVIRDDNGYKLYIVSDIGRSMKVNGIISFEGVYGKSNHVFLSEKYYLFEN